MADLLSQEKEKWRYFVDVAVWPRRSSFDPLGWMENFSVADQPMAIRLLSGFVYYSHDHVQQMFRSSFLNLSQITLTTKSNYVTAKIDWARFIANLLVVRVTGENPSDADSGYAFVRHARDTLMIEEEQLCTPEKAIEELVSGQRESILFADDFVGSGEQFCKMWERPYEVGKTGRKASLRDIAAIAGDRIKFYYCPVICTSVGLARIRRDCPKVRVCPAHVLSSKHSAISPDAVIWKNFETVKGAGSTFVERVSRAAGIPDLNGGVGCWRGFNKLGLSLAFAHGWPDATLPLFYWNENGWKPLLRKGAL